MITDSEMAGMTLPQRFFEYAIAYRNAASAMCSSMVKDQAMRTWPNANVVLLLAAHSTELFLKGAIFSRDPLATTEHHFLDSLGTEYNRLFPEPQFNWKIPFRTDWRGFSEAELEVLRKTSPVPSMLYRYPVSKGRKEWNGAFGFEAGSFMEVLEQVDQDFQRIMAHIAQPSVPTDAFGAAEQ
jgi:hypothetical protein